MAILSIKIWYLSTCKHNTQTFEGLVEDKDRVERREFVAGNFQVQTNDDGDLSINVSVTSLMCIFLLDFGAERYVEVKYGVCRKDPEPIMTSEVDNSTVDKASPGNSRKSEADVEELSTYANSQ
ncbi:high affinity zinc ion transporter [Aspergillus tubingensis]|uniref:high affinity zinc ion transporter n=1 Tax=Aspergillus tubingensis TaxID=5068 RepID=UPI001579AA69|nr:high affinity zinc ion transporter [Aspergillus tubingensis]GFN20162.1 high affinity zinc ion transporter [Aspergillus tubingensis]